MSFDRYQLSVTKSFNEYLINSLETAHYSAIITQLQQWLECNTIRIDNTDVEWCMAVRAPIYSIVYSTLTSLGVECENFDVDVYWKKEGKESVLHILLDNVNNDISNMLFRHNKLMLSMLNQNVRVQ